MELTLNLPDEMVSRLRPHENRLGQILQLGLEAFETAAPTPEELLAYAQGELDDEARADLMERLALDADAVDDLLDFHHFEELEPPSAEHALSDHDVSEALGAFKKRVGAEQDPVEVESEGPARSVARAKPLTARRPGRYRPVLAMAASLLLAVGALWILRPVPKTTGLLLDTQLELNSARGGRTFSLPPEAENVLLVLPATDLLAGHPGQMRISASRGEVVYQKEVLGTGSDIFLALPGKKLPTDSYRLEIIDSTTGERVHELEFEIRVPPDL
jgi:hypothetical protein